MVDVTEIEDKIEIDLAKLLQILRDHQLMPIALQTQSSEIKRLAREFYLAVFTPHAIEKNEEPVSQNHEPLIPKEIVSQRNASLIINQPIRSGQQVYAKGGDLIVLAPVSQGAEILADGPYSCLWCITWPCVCRHEWRYQSSYFLPYPCGRIYFYRWTLSSV